MKVIKEREKSKMYSKDFDKANKKLGKGKGYPCLICKNNCCTHTNSICLFCEDYDKLLFFIRVSCFFKILGSMYLFFWFLDDCTFEYICENAEKFASIFKNGIDIPIIEKYGVYKKIYDELHPPLYTGPEIEESEEEESDDDDPDEEHKILQALEDRYLEKEAKKREKEAQKVMEMIEKHKKRKEELRRRKRERTRRNYNRRKFIGVKRINNQAIKIRPRSSTNRESQLENLSILKSLLEDKKEEKTLDNFGDHSLV